MVAVIVAGVVWIAGQKKETGAKPEKIVPAIPAVATSSRMVILFGVPAPSVPSDKLFELTLPSKMVKERAVESGWRLTQMVKAPLAIQASGKNDGGFMLIGKGWDVPLRAKNAAPYQQVTWLGMWDATHAALSAQNNGEALLSVSRTGEIREIYQIPQDVNSMGFHEGSAWFASFQPGEGIESLPQGPSNLIRVAANGVSTAMASSTQIITSVAVGPAQVFAYQNESGDMIAESGSLRWSGTGRPLLWLDDHRLLFAKGTRASIVDLSDQQAPLQTAAILPLAPAAAQLEP